MFIRPLLWKQDLKRDLQCVKYLLCIIDVFVTEKTLAYTELGEKQTAGCGCSMTQHANHFFSSAQHKNLCKNKWKVDCNKNAWKT